MKIIINEDDAWLIRIALLSYKSGQNMELLEKLKKQNDAFW